MSYPKVSIIILNWNGLQDTLACLDSVKKSNYPNYEIIVIDNASKNDEATVIKSKWPEVNLIKNDNNLGFAGGSNLGLRRALEIGADYIWLLNNDTVIYEDTLDELIRVGETDKKIGLLSPVIYNFSEPDKIQFCGSYFDQMNFTIKHIENLKEVSEMDKSNICLWGTALLIKREVIDVIGYLSEKFFAYYEDSEYSFRALRNNFLNRIVVSSRVLHKGNFIFEKGVFGLPLYYFFYMSRNRYWVWHDNIKWFKRAIFFRKYLAMTLRGYGLFLKEYKHKDGADAYLDGAYCALKNYGGQWGRDKKTPKIIKTFLSSHPFLLADIIDLNVKTFFKNLVKKKSVN